MGTNSLKPFSKRKFSFGAHLEFQTTMTKLTLISTFWLLTGAATVLGMPQVPTGQVRLLAETLEPRQTNLRTGEDSTFDLNIQELAEKVEQGIPKESEVDELVDEAEKDQEKIKNKYDPNLCFYLNICN